MRGADSGGESSTVRVALTAALIVGILGIVVAVATGAETEPSRLDRKVQVMERVLDEVLVQSPNVLVASPGGTTRGLVLPGYGAVFTLKASLGGAWLQRMGEGNQLVTGDESFKFFVLQRDETEESKEESATSGSQHRSPEHDPAARLARFKTELVDAMLDYGPTLTELRDDDWLVIAAFLDGQRLLGTGEGRRLVLRAKMRDLRQYSSGALSRDAAAKRVTVEDHG